MGIAPQGVNIQPSVIYISPYGLNVSPQGAPGPPSGQGPLLPCNARVLVRRRFVARARCLAASCLSQSSGCVCVPMQRCCVCLLAHRHVRCPPPKLYLGCSWLRPVRVCAGFNVQPQLIAVTPIEYNSQPQVRRPSAARPCGRPAGWRRALSMVLDCTACSRVLLTRRPQAETNAALP